MVPRFGKPEILKLLVTVSKTMILRLRYKYLPSCIQSVFLVHITFQPLVSQKIFLAKYVCQFIIVDLRLFSVYFIGMILVF